MSLLNSVTNLTTSIADKARQLSTIGKIAACLPSIITSLPATLGATAGKAVLGAVNSVKSALSGAGGFLQGIVNETVNRIINAVTGLVNTVLQVQAQIISSINQLKRLAQFLEDEYNDTVEYIKNSENCKFAAAELVNCVAGRLLAQLSDRFNSRVGDILSVDSFVDDIVSKIEEPGAKLSGWVDNTARQIDKATSIVNATRLF